jgi:hypothetical protein
MTKSLRFHIYGNDHNEILNRHKTEWQGRFYKNLHGKGQGWSFPIHKKQVIQEYICLHTNECASPLQINENISTESPIQNENEKDTTISESSSVCSLSTILTTHSNNDSVPSISTIDSERTDYVQTQCRHYKWDIPVEVYKYFQDVLM